MSTFRTDLVATIPNLRSFAFRLTRNADRRDDLVQQALVLALTHEDKFDLGTDIRAWAFKILYRRHLSNLRPASASKTVSIDGLADVFVSDLPDQMDVMRRRDFWRAIDKIPKHQSDVLIANLHGYSRKEMAARFGVERGTTASRSSRACASLRALIAGDVASVPQRAVRS